MQGVRDHPWPKFALPGKARVGKAAQVDLVLRHGALIMPNENDVSSVSSQPFGHILWIVYASAEQEQLCG